MKVKKIVLYRKGYEDVQGRYNSVEEAQRAVRNLVEDEEKDTIFDYFYKEEDYEEITDRVKTYEDACKVLNIKPIDEQKVTEIGFGPYDIARKKLETVVEALNEGWKPDWNDTGQNKCHPFFKILKNGKSKGFPKIEYMGVYFNTTTAYLYSRFVFRYANLARYAGQQFLDLYEQLIIKEP